MRSSQSASASLSGGSLSGVSSMMLQQQQMHQPMMTVPELQQPQDPVMGEYGELQEAAAAGGLRMRMPPAPADQHSYAGMSDITSDPGY